MPETKAQQRRPAAKKPAARKQASARKAVPTRKRREADTSTVDRTTQLSEDLLKSLEEGLGNALDGMRKFIETVEDALPLRAEEGPRRREEVTDAALDMAQRLIDTQYEFLSKVVDYRRERIHHRRDRRRSHRRHAGRRTARSHEVE